MADYSKVTRTDEAIIIEHDPRKSKWFQEYVIEKVLVTVSYQDALASDAQLMRSRELERAGKLVSSEQAYLEASRQSFGDVVYITSLQKKEDSFRESLLGS